MSNLPHSPFRPPPTYSPVSIVHPFFCKPICPSANRRYNRSPIPYDAKCALPNIPANTTVRSYSEGNLEGELPCGWSERLHPEGDPYSYHGDKKLLTNLDPRNPQIRKFLYQAYDDIVSRLGTRDDVEIYIDLEFPQTQPLSVIASYYLADHKSRQIFWPFDVDFNVVGIPQCQTKGQLKSFLTSEYWVHVDYFPLPDYFALYFSEPEAELIAILIHCAVDDKTAPGSTSPWGANECQQYANMLKDLRSLDQRTSYRVASVARLYSALCRARHINSWGQPNARLDRLQAYTEFTPLRSSFFISACEVASFGVSIGVLRRMSTLFNGRVVFHRHWDVFFEDIRSTWLQTTGINGLILLCDIALIVSKLNNIATAASASLSGASIFIGIFLHQKHPQWKLATGPDISQYIMSVEDYYQGLRPLSIILALPQTASIYSALAFHIGLLLVVTDRVAQAQEAMWTLVAMAIGLIPLAASLRFFAPPPKPKPEADQQSSAGIKSIWKKLKGAPVQERNV